MGSYPSAHLPWRSFQPPLGTASEFGGSPFRNWVSPVFVFCERQCSRRNCLPAKLLWVLQEVLPSRWDPSLHFYLNIWRGTSIEGHLQTVPVSNRGSMLLSQVHSTHALSFSFVRCAVRHTSASGHLIVTMPHSFACSLILTAISRVTHITRLFYWPFMSPQRLFQRIRNRTTYFSRVEWNIGGRGGEALMEVDRRVHAFRFIGFCRPPPPKYGKTPFTHTKHEKLNPSKRYCFIQLFFVVKFYLFWSIVSSSCRCFNPYRCGCSTDRSLSVLGNQFELEVNKSSHFFFISFLRLVCMDLTLWLLPHY